MVFLEDYREWSKIELGESDNYAKKLFINDLVACV